MNHFVSVVIPTFNRARVLGRSIKSVLNQTYTNFELIIVDDCSNDNTAAVIKSFHDERIVHITHEKNKGGFAARNTGIKAARGKYIAFQDSDDEWLPSKLSKQMKLFDSASPDIGVVYTSFWLICKETRTLFPFSGARKTEGNIHNALLEANFVGIPTAVVRKECFEKVGLFEALPCLQDWSLWLKISKYYCFKHVNEPLVNAYWQSDSISINNMYAYLLARKYILNTYFGEISKKPKLLRQHYFEIGTFLCLNGEIGEGRTYFFDAMKINPLDAKLLLSVFASTIGLGAYNKITSVYLRAKGQE